MTYWERPHDSKHINHVIPTRPIARPGRVRIHKLNLIRTLARGDVGEGSNQIELVRSTGTLTDSELGATVWGIGEEIGGALGVLLVDLPEAGGNNNATGKCL